MTKSELIKVIENVYRPLSRIADEDLTKAEKQIKNAVLPALRKLSGEWEKNIVLPAPRKLGTQ